MKIAFIEELLYHIVSIPWVHRHTVTYMIYMQLCRYINACRNFGTKRLQGQFSSCFEAQIPLSAGLASAAQSLNPALRAVPELAGSPGGWLIHTFFAGLSVNLIHDQNCQPKTHTKKKKTHVTSSLFFFSSCPAKRSSDQVIELAVCQRHAAVEY